jgi:hypothetical protein
MRARGSPRKGEPDKLLFRCTETECQNGGLPEFNSYSISALQTVPVYLPVRYVTLTRSFSRNLSHCA